MHIVRSSQPRRTRPVRQESPSALVKQRSLRWRLASSHKFDTLPFFDSVVFDGASEDLGFALLGEDGEGGSEEGEGEVVEFCRVS
jgi:hypothetical protein